MGRFKGEIYSSYSSDSFLLIFSLKSFVERFNSLSKVDVENSADVKFRTINDRSERCGTSGYSGAQVCVCNSMRFIASTGFRAILLCGRYRWQRRQTAFQIGLGSHESHDRISVTEYVLSMYSHLVL